MPVTRLPKKLRVGSRTFHVTHDTELLQRGFDPEADVMGRFYEDLSQVVIAPRLNYDAASATLTHELVHAMWAEAGLTEAAPEVSDHEELVVCALAGQLLNVLRRNPALVRYLTEKRGE